MLVQQLNSIEALSHADVLCIDKTGTITSNRLLLREVIRLAEREPSAERLIGMFAASPPEPNATLQAIASCPPAEPCPITTVVPFSSQRGWSLLAFAPS
jgi:cation-transporting P-type ATPase E